MILERAEFCIRKGGEADFITMMAEGLTILADAPGCHSVEFGRGVERPDAFILLLTWGGVEEHITFTQTPEFARFKAMAFPYFAGSVSMEHFNIV